MKFWLLLILSFLLGCSAVVKTRKNNEVRSDFIQRTKELEQKCHAGEVFKCSQFIKNYAVLYGSHLAIELASSKCQSPKDYYCYAVPYLKYFSGSITEANIEQENLCRQGNFYSCFFLAHRKLITEEKSQKFTPNAYLDRACELGDHVSCLFKKIYLPSRDEKSVLNAYNDFIKTHRTEKDLSYMLSVMPYIHSKRPEQALRYLKSMCDDGNQDACFYEKAYLSDKSQREVLSQEFCQKSSSLACLTNCEFQLNKMNKDTDYSSCHQGCLLGNLQSCFYSGNIEPDNRHLEKRIFYSKLSCIHGLAQGCQLLAHYLEKIGRTDEAVKYLQVACDSGVRSSCNNIKKLENR